MDDRVKPWVRIGIAVLAVPQLLTGLWATLATRSWWESYPGVGPDLVAALPPFNEHLASDAGAGFLATGVALAIAAATGRRPHVDLALITFLAFTLPHTIHHATHGAPGLTGAEDLYAVGLLAGGVVLAAVLLVGAHRQDPRDVVSPADDVRASV